MEMTDFLNKILDFFLPPRCKICGKVISDNNGLCPECFQQISFISTPYCAKCGRPFFEAPHNHNLLCGCCAQEKKSLFRMNRAAVCYDDASKNLLLGLKFFDKTDNVPLLAKWLKLGGQDIFNAGVDLIIPTPLHYLRLVKRHYNQSALLAHELSKLTGIEVNYSALIRSRYTKPQVSFSGKARIKNVKNAFYVKHPQDVCDKRILLIDDVMTTGSTLKECALVLKKAGAKSVDSLTVARTFKD